MRLIYIFVTLNVWNWVASKPSVEIKEVKTVRSLAKDLLIELYFNNMFLVDKNYAENAKNLSENLLKDTKFQEAKSIPLQDFNDEIKDFLQEYCIYRHYGLYNKLVKIFAEITRSFYFLTDHPDSYYIKRILREYGYNGLKDKYENEFKRFMTEIVLTKFLEFITKHPVKNYKFSEQLLEWSKNLKDCEEFYCCKRLFEELIDILYSPNEKVLRNIKINLNDINIEHMILAQDMVNSVLKDPKLSLLNSDLKATLTNDITHFIKEYESDKNIDNLNDLLNIFEKNLTMKYYSNREIPIKDQELIRNIFDDNGYAEMKKYVQVSLRDFIESDLPWIFQKFNDKMCNVLPLQKDLLKWFDYIEHLDSYEGSRKAIKMLKDLKQIKLKDILSFERV